ncbi:MAG: dTDP-4-dehydrorhamnose 3,5-epimerase [Actinomycetia bacterium]|nr:dTDP-4-dehydrorhamnose 3,5-epimerase [Actinomycetes bacterium]
MRSEPLRIDGAWVFTPRVFGDERGAFFEAFTAEALAAAVGHPLALAQVNQSLSRRGVIRGVHYALVPPSQAKYVRCPRGAVLDVVVDIRLGSPTFGQWDAVRLDDVDHRAVYLAEGLGHAFLALADDTVVSYLCSTGYNPQREFGVNPLDERLGLPWPAEIEPILSPKDAAAPTLDQAAARGLLPDHSECLAYYQALGG